MTKKESAKLERELTAYHEAGHAVIALMLGIKLDYVTIVPSDSPSANSYGLCSTKMPKWFKDGERSDRAQVLAERRITFIYSGLHAEARYRGKREGRGCREILEQGLGTTGDDQDADTLVDLTLSVRGVAGVLMSRRVTDAYLKYCWQASREMVDFHWLSIQAVAAALIEKGALDDKEVRGVCRSALIARLKC
jgi:hypothetical protein